MEIAGGHVRGAAVSNGAYGTQPSGVKLLWVHPGEAKPQEDCLQNAPGFCCASCCGLLPYSCSIWHGVVTI